MIKNILNDQAIRRSSRNSIRRLIRALAFECRKLSSNKRCDTGLHRCLMLHASETCVASALALRSMTSSHRKMMCTFASVSSQLQCVDVSRHTVHFHNKATKQAGFPEQSLGCIVDWNTSGPFFRSRCAFHSRDMTHGSRVPRQCTETLPGRAALL